MNIFSFLTGGVVKTVEEIAKEWIDTPMEKAEAGALMLKTLDPNGKMRRDISRAVSRMYVSYIVIMTGLVITQAYGFGDVEGTKLAIDSMTNLFVPITASFTAIVGASFGVSGINSMKGK